jgi:hypothetical protein
MRESSAGAAALPVRISRVRLHRMRQKRRERILLYLLLLLLILSAAFGLYLASRGLHPKQLRRRHSVRVVGQSMLEGMTPRRATDRSDMLC